MALDSWIDLLQFGTASAVGRLDLFFVTENVAQRLERYPQIGTGFFRSMQTD